MFVFYFFNMNLFLDRKNSPKVMYNKFYIIEPKKKWKVTL